MRYHAHPNGYLTIDNDPRAVLRVERVDDGVQPGAEYLAIHTARQVILSELASDGNHAREWAARAAAVVTPNRVELDDSVTWLLREMAEYHRDGQEGKS